MRDTVAEHRADLLELAAELVGADPFDRVDEGTRFAQPRSTVRRSPGGSASAAPTPASPPATRLVSSRRWRPAGRSTSVTGCGSRSSAAR